jgi:hypothetical protein
MKTPTLLLLGVLAASAAAACSGGSDSSDGGPETSTSTCPPKPALTCTNPKSPPSYTKDVAPIVKVRCAPCHFAGGISDKIEDFSTLSGVANAGTAIINQLVGPPACAMPPIYGNTLYDIPPGTVPGLTEAQEETIVQWIVCGEPNN